MSLHEKIVNEEVNIKGMISLFKDSEHEFYENLDRIKVIDSPHMQIFFVNNKHFSKFEEATLVTTFKNPIFVVEMMDLFENDTIKLALWPRAIQRYQICCMLCFKSYSAQNYVSHSYKRPTGIHSKTTLNICIFNLPNEITSKNPSRNAIFSHLGINTIYMQNELIYF
jgi:hypothetical protein